VKLDASLIVADSVPIAPAVPAVKPHDGPGLQIIDVAVTVGGGGDDPPSNHTAPVGRPAGDAAHPGFPQIVVAPFKSPRAVDMKRGVPWVMLVPIAYGPLVAPQTPA
jgi:hypothetical protein